VRPGVHGYDRTAIQGSGGVGKTTVCAAVTRDDEVKRHFSDGILVLRFHEGISDDEVSSLIHEAVYDTEGFNSAIEISRLWHTSEMSSDRRLGAIAKVAGKWFNGKHVLVYVDNVWRRHGDGLLSHETHSTLPLQWPELLSCLLAESNGRLLFSTRDRTLSDGSKEISLDKLDVTNSAEDRAEAVEIFESYPGIEAGRDDEEYVQAREKILEMCDGWQLVLAMCGALLSLNRDKGWSNAVSWLRTEVHREWCHGAAVQHRGLKAVMAASLRFLDTLTADDPLLDGFGQVGFKDMYAALAVFAAARAVPVHVLAPLFGVSREVGERIGRLFERTGIARLEKGEIFSLHDLQYEFAMRLCEEKGVSVAQRHERLLDGYARIELGSSTGLEAGLDWASKGVPGRVVEKGHDEYLSGNLALHMAVAARGGDERLKQCLLALMCDYRWVRARAAAYDRWSFLDDCRGAGAVDVLTAGERCAVGMIGKVVLSTRESVFGADDRCPVHGAFDTGCAGELHGRLSALKFGRLDGQGRREALAVFASMKESIHTYARRPWLCPRNECYQSVEEDEEGCEIAFSAGGDSIIGVAILDVNGRRVLVSGCRDGAVRVHDLDAGGRMVREWREDESFVIDFAVASGGSEGSGESNGRALAASCSFDGTVRLRDIGGGAGGGGGCVAVLHSNKGKEGPEVCCHHSGRASRRCWRVTSGV
jgi:NB-ARC domain